LEETEKVTTSDGLQLQCVSWIPEGAPIATLTFIHGFGEHLGRYSHVFPPFAEAGIRVNSFEQRGHGRSDGVRGHSPSLEQSLFDIDLITAKADRNIPHFLMGHSLGGGLVLIYASKHTDMFDGIISQDPLIRLTMEISFFTVLLGRMASYVAPTFKIPQELRYNDLTRDPVVNKAYSEDPQIVKGITSRMAAMTLDMETSVFEGCPNVTKPILLVHGTDDKLTSHAATKEYYEKVPSTDKTFKSLEGWYHEPHNEPEKEEYIKSVVDWVVARIKK